MTNSSCNSADGGSYRRLSTEHPPTHQHNQNKAHNQLNHCDSPGINASATELTAVCRVVRFFLLCFFVGPAAGVQTVFNPGTSARLQKPASRSGFPSPCHRYLPTGHSAGLTRHECRIQDSGTATDVSESSSSSLKTTHSDDGIKPEPQELSGHGFDVAGDNPPPKEMSRRKKPTFSPESCNCIWVRHFQPITDFRVGRKNQSRGSVAATGRPEGQNLQICRAR